MGYMIKGGFGPDFAGMGVFFLLIIWSLYWKGRSLWRAARLGQLEWFIALLVINSAGLLDIAYLYYFTSGEDKEEEVEVVPEKSEQ